MPENENITALKVHQSKPVFSDPGHVRPDFRGENAVGSKQGDGHMTFFEIDPFDVTEVGEAMKDTVAKPIADAVVEALQAQGVDTSSIDVGAVVGQLDAKSLAEEAVLAVLAAINRQSVRNVSGSWFGQRAGLWDGDNRA